MGRVGGLEVGGWKVGGLEVEGLVVFFKKKVRRLMHRRLLAWDEEILGDQSDCNWWNGGRRGEDGCLLRRMFPTSGRELAANGK